MNYKINIAINATLVAMRANEAKWHLLRTSVQYELLQGICDYATKEEENMVQALKQVTAFGQGRTSTFCDFVEYGKHYSTLHWCVIDYATCLLQEVEWKKPVNPNGLGKTIPTAQEIEEYEIKLMFEDIISRRVSFEL